MSSIRFHVLAVASLLTLSNCAGRMNVSERMMWSTYPLITNKGAGTGFVLNRRLPNSSGMQPVIFTSAHVLDSVGRGPLVIGVRMPDAKGEAQVALIAFNPPMQRDQKRFYVKHPQHDLAAFELHLPEDFTGRAEMPTCLSESMLARSGRTLHSGNEVSFLGYPEVLPGTAGAFPVLRSGRIASYPLGTSQAQGRFLINSDVYPGDSGAPVFIIGRGTRPELVGVVIQRIGPKTSSFSHLAVAVDVDTIRETLAMLGSVETHITPAPATRPAKPKH
jgi:hypothetical protein